MSVEEKILQILRNEKLGLTINDISKRAGINRVTASKYLAVLEAKNLIKHRNVGKAKLFFIEEVVR